MLIWKPDAIDEGYVSLEGYYRGKHVGRVEPSLRDPSLWRASCVSRNAEGLVRFKLLGKYPDELSAKEAVVEWVKGRLKHAV